MPENPREQFLRALQAMQQGRLDDCEQLVDQLIALNPREVNAQRLRAQCELSRGATAAAAARLQRVVAIAADYAEGWSDLGRAQQQLGDSAAAVISWRRALTINPKLGSAARALQAELQAQGDSAGAAAVAAQRPSRSARAQTLRELRPLLADSASRDQQQRGEQLAIAALQADPLNQGVALLLFKRAIATNRAEWAEQIAGRLTAALPELGRWWLQLATALSRQDKLEQAEQACQRALEVTPSWPEALLLQGSLASKDNRFERALCCFEAVLAQRPEQVAALSQRATTLKTLGRSDEAIADYRRCLALDPSCGEAAWSLANLKTYRFSDAEVTAINEQLANPELADQERVYFGYALAKAREHQRQWPQAFAAYAAANRVKRAMVQWDRARFSAQVDAIIATFNPQLLARLAGSGCSDRSPLFILGLPRSGSTLQEQILASHSAVEGTRELPYMPWLAGSIAKGATVAAGRGYPAGVAQLDGAALGALGERYLAQAARHRSTGHGYFIDKLPNNFIYLGLILCALPNAKIINTRREPMDNCFGCFKQLWAEGQHFSYDLEDLGHYYRDYLRLMAHWQQCFPGRILDVDYEQVVADLESHVARLLDFLGLPFEQQCIDFHQTERAVNTASSEQVRQPIYTSAVAYWRHFERELAPLRAALGDALPATAATTESTIDPTTSPTPLATQ